MPLNLSVNDGDFVPYLKYNSKAGRFYVRAEGVDGEIEIEKPILAIDFANIQTGWICYQEGSGPQTAWDPDASTAAPKPPIVGNQKWQRGFNVLVYSNAMIPGTTQKIGLREFNSTANNTISAIKQMHGQYEEKAVEHPGKVPVFACTGVKAVTTKHGTNYEPVFHLAQWVDRSRVPGLDAEPLRPAPQQQQHQPVYGAPNPPPPNGPADYGADPVWP